MPSREPVCTVWDYHNSFFFSFTVITTIGYGHQAPTTTHGKLICILYALMGIPLNAILISSLGSLFRDRVQKLKARVWASLDRAGVQLEGQSRAVAVLAESAFLFLLYFVLFLPLPAAVFTALENKGRWADGQWSFLDSLYYTFITLSTIGFGDMVPHLSQAMVSSAVWRWVYMAGILAWVILGMGYICGVIQDTNRAGSKPVKKLLHLEDYWSMILGKILLAKRGEGEELLGGPPLGGAGRSQPCLTPSEGRSVLRRACAGGRCPRAVLAREEEVVVAPNHMTADQEASVVSLGHDTITSLRQFLTRVQDPSCAQNNLPGQGSRGEEQGSTTSTTMVHHLPSWRDPSVHPTSSTASSHVSSESRVCADSIANYEDEEELGEHLEAAHSTVMAAAAKATYSKAE